MPVKITHIKNDGYKVSTPHGVKAKHTTKAKAEAQRHFLMRWNTDGNLTGKKKK